MHSKIPQEQDDIRQRLAGRWISGQETIDGQVDGLTNIVSGFQRVLEPILGSVAVRAILSRAARIARERCPQLGNVVLVEGGLDVARLRVDLCAATPEDTQEVVIALVDGLFVVLHELLGNALTPLLREVEAELATGESAAGADEEER